MKPQAGASGRPFEEVKLPGWASCGINFLYKRQFNAIYYKIYKKDKAIFLQPDDHSIVEPALRSLVFCPVFL